MFNWFWKRLGYHVCEEWTQWEKKKQNYTRQATETEAVFNQVQTVDFTETWQERHCTICGKIQQERLRN